MKTLPQQISEVVIYVQGMLYWKEQRSGRCCVQVHRGIKEKVGVCTNKGGEGVAGG